MDLLQRIAVARNEISNYIEKLGQTLGLDGQGLLLALHEAENTLRLKIEISEAYMAFEEIKETKEEEPKED